MKAKIEIEISPAHTIIRFDTDDPIKIKQLRKALKGMCIYV